MSIDFSKEAIAIDGEFNAYSLEYFLSDSWNYKDFGKFLPSRCYLLQYEEPQDILLFPGRNADSFIVAFLSNSQVDNFEYRTFVTFKAVTREFFDDIEDDREKKIALKFARKINSSITSDMLITDLRKKTSCDSSELLDLITDEFIAGLESEEIFGGIQTI